MTPEQYHQLLIGLDRALFVFHEAQRDLSSDDEKLRQRIAIIRAQVLRAESGHPFPFGQPGEAENDPDLTRVPWQSGS